MLFPPNDTAGAIFSDCRRYRYRLWRVWDTSKPAVAFCMLNPSTADENVLDPTLRRCMNFAKSWGFGRMDIVNLFAFRATDPEVMKAERFPTAYLESEENNDTIKKVWLSHDKMICAWGCDGAHHNRGPQIKAKFDNLRFYYPNKRLYHLGLTKDGHPRHPLYLKSDLKPILWE